MQSQKLTPVKNLIIQYYPHGCKTDELGDIQFYYIEIERFLKKG